MAFKTSPAALKQDRPVTSHDPIWSAVRGEAEMAASSEPALGGFLFATILSHTKLEDAICHRLAQRLNHADVDAGLISQMFTQVLAHKQDIGEIFRADLQAVFDRDPACTRYIEPLLYFKGFHALVTHRFAHELWKDGRRDFALYLQSQSSRIFGVDINPNARMGRGIMLDHGTGIVIGETAVVGDNCSILQNVTLGGNGKERMFYWQPVPTCLATSVLATAPKSRPARLSCRTFPPIRLWRAYLPALLAIAVARSQPAAWTSASSPTIAVAATERLA
jgi:serine O-acetyltransferase